MKAIIEGTFFLYRSYNFTSTVSLSLFLNGSICVYVNIKSLITPVLNTYKSIFQVPFLKLVNSIK